MYELFTILYTLMMASAQVVETSVNTNNSPSQDYTTNQDDRGAKTFSSLQKDQLPPLILNDTPIDKSSNSINHCISC